MKRDLVRELGGWDSATVAADDYRLVLAAANAGHTVRRVSRALYRRRTALPRHFNTPAAIDARRTTVGTLLDLQGRTGQVVPDDGPARLRVRYPIEGRPLVSIIIATRDRLRLLDQCIRSIEARTTYDNFEIVIVDNDSTEPETLRYFAATPHRVVPSPGPFNFSAINNAGVRAARGAFVLFLNNDTEVITPTWLEEMLTWAEQPEIGCVGAKLLFGDGRLQHVGVTLQDGSAGHPGHGDIPSAENWLNTDVVRNYSAVTAACLMVRKDVLDDAGSFDETFPAAYNDVELCVRIGRKGYRNLYTPYAVLYHHESSSREPGVTLAENAHLREVVGAVLWNDPYAAGRDSDAQPSGIAGGIGRTLGPVARLSKRARDVLSAVRWQRTSIKAAEEIGSSPSGSDAIRWIDRVDVGGDARTALFMHPVAERTYRVSLPRGGRFDGWIALMPDVWQKQVGGVTFEVCITRPGGAPRRRAQTIDPRRRPRDRKWRRLRVHVPPSSSGDVEITLRTSLPPGGAPAHAWAVWGDPTVLEPKRLTDIATRQTRLIRSLGPRGALRWVRTDSFAVHRPTTPSTRTGCDSSAG